MHVAVNPVTVAAAGLIAYLVGSVPVGWLVARGRGKDLRDWGSGNVGTSNLYRNVDSGLAALVGPAQFAQGLLPVVLVRLAGMPVQIQAVAGICAVIGNGWPVWLGFNGGRGIAVGTGVVAGLSPLALLVLLACYALGAGLHRIAVGVLGGFLILPLVAAVWVGASVAVAAIGILLLVLLRRLEGVRGDSRRYGHTWRIVVRRLVRDERPGRPLVGRRTDA